MMNRIMTDDLSTLDIQKISNLMFISTIIMPIEKLSPSNYVEVWLRSNKESESQRNFTRESMRQKFNDQTALYYLFE